MAVSLAGNRISDVTSRTTPLAGMTALKRLDLRENGVADITPLAGMVELEWLYLAGNRISDVTPLAAMTALRALDLDENGVTDITPLAGMVELGRLYLAGNRISDVSPLAAMTTLRSLSLQNNAVSDIGPLVDRSIFGGAGSAGARVNLDGNPLDATSVREHIPTLTSWGISVRFTRRGSKVAATAMDDPTLRALVAETLAYADPARGRRHVQLANRPAPTAEPLWAGRCEPRGARCREGA